MKIIEKFNEKQKSLENAKPITIAFLGDSVTQGCFEVFRLNKEQLETVFDYKSAYSTRLKEIINVLYPNVQINVINSGISGDSADFGIKRLERDILSFNPDLCVVSYGLNDCYDKSVETYTSSLDEIFKKLKEKNIETIFLTQNAMCTKTSCHVTDDLAISASKEFAEIQNSGKLKKYIEEAKKTAKENGVKICDLYPVWEKMINSGVDTNELLANKLNHPIREYHYYIAVKLLEIMFEL